MEMIANIALDTFLWSGCMLSWAIPVGSVPKVEHSLCKVKRKIQFIQA